MRRERSPLHPAEVRELIHPVRWRVRSAVVLTALSALVTAGGLVAVAWLITTLLDQTVVWLPVIIAGGALSAGVLLRVAADVIAHRADADLAHHTRSRAADALERAPFAWLHAQGPGRIRKVIADDVTTMHHLVAHSYTDLTAAIMTPLIAALVIGIVDAKLLLVLIPPVVVALAIGRRMARINSAKMPGYGAAAASLGQEITEFLQAAPVLRSFGQHGASTTRLRRADRAFVDYFLSWARPLIRPETLQAQLVSPVTLLAIIVLAGAVSAAAGWTSPFAVILALLLGLSVSGPLTAIADNARSLQMARGAARAISDLIAAPSDEIAGALDFPSVTDLVLDGVSYERDGTMILDDIHLDIPEGSHVAIVGPSGAGKTTLARLLVGLVTPTSGTITIGGTPLEAIRSDARRASIGYLGQHSHLLRVSVAENVALHEGPDERRVYAALRSAALDDVIGELPAGVRTVVGDDHVFSGGQQQRLSIARIAFDPPRMLVMDEPTARVDVETEHAVQAGVSALLAAGHPATAPAIAGRGMAGRGMAGQGMAGQGMAEHGTAEHGTAGQGEATTVVVSHRLETTADADLIVVLDGGRIVQRGTHASLLAVDGVYRRLWTAQQLDAEGAGAA